MSKPVRYLRNTWYVAGQANELKLGEIVGRRILDEAIALFRTAEGRVAALQDRCPHRFVPLHLGKVAGNNLQCAYHGLEFDCSGKCAKAPFGDRIPAAAAVKSYPLVERYDMLWIWMGNAEQATPDTIPDDFGCLVDPKRAHLHGYQKVACNYELATDNVADLSHVQFLHGSFMDSRHSAKLKFELEEVGQSVISKFSYPGISSTPQWDAFAGHALPEIDRWTDVRWTAPSNILLDGGVTPAGRPRAEGLQFYGAHLLTPETATSAHYWYCHCRGFRIDEPEVDAMVRRWQQVAFHEQDKPMLEEQQRAMGDETDVLAMRPVLLTADAGAVRIRRRLKAMIEAELRVEAAAAETEEPA